jgi:hypothetical protein
MRTRAKAIDYYYKNLPNRDLLHKAFNLWGNLMECSSVSIFNFNIRYTIVRYTNIANIEAKNSGLF